MSWTRWILAVAMIVGGVTGGCEGDRPLSARQFTELVADRVEAEHPGVLITSRDERGFDFTRGTGERGRIVVTEEYVYYRQHPEALDDLVDRLVSLLGTRARLRQVGDDEGRLRRSIMPVLKPQSFLGEAEVRAGGQRVLYGEHALGLLVFYVLDEPTSISYLSASSLPSLALSRRQLSDLALTNLARRTSADRFVVQRTDLGPIAVGDTRDGYDAARLISPTLLLTLSRLLDTSSVVVAIPRRDLLLAVPAHEPALVDQLRPRALIEYRQGPYAITDELFRLDRDGLRRLESEP